MELGLGGTACIVTGATRGIGLATARMLAEEGARVLLVARDEQQLGRVRDELGGDDVDVFAADVTEPGDGDRIVAACEQRFGAVGALVNNAGTSFVRSLEELSD